MIGLLDRQVITLRLKLNEQWILNVKKSSVVLTRVLEHTVTEAIPMVSVCAESTWVGITPT